MDKERLKQYLQDAGCSSNSVSCIIERLETDDLNGMMLLMKKERCRALDEFHESGRKVDCMDFILRNFEKENK
ncbi:MAG: hypothetical protein K5644_00230 [Lachnospiraceae bacterium]|nr:hypothetical protein [Lachnospiraceae bacterium]